MVRQLLYLKERMLLFSIAILAILCAKSLEGQSREQLLKAGFVEKFTHFVEWPERSERIEYQFRISVIGDNKLAAALSQIFRQVKVSGKSVVVEESSSEFDLSDSEIVVISKNVGANEFEINRSALEKSGLKMSSLLIKSGILIDSN